MGEKFTFVKREDLGSCECCSKDVFDNTLYVKDENKIYHLSCYNMMKKEESEKIE